MSADHGRIELECPDCGTRVSTPVLTVEGVEAAATTALELYLHHRTEQHEEKQ